MLFICLSVALAAALLVHGDGGCSEEEERVWFFIIFFLGQEKLVAPLIDGLFFCYVAK